MSGIYTIKRTRGAVAKASKNKMATFPQQVLLKVFCHSTFAPAIKPTLHL